MELDRGSGTEPPFVTLSIHVFDTDGTTDEKGYYRIRVSVPATLRFSDVADVDLRDFGLQNVLSALAFEPAEKTGVRSSRLPSAMEYGVRSASHTPKSSMYDHGRRRPKTRRQSATSQQRALSSLATYSE